MKMRREVLYILPIIVFVLIINAIKVNAMGTGFLVEELTDNEKNTFESNFVVSSLTRQPAKKAIQCFDVNRQGEVVVGQNTSDHKEICIYNTDGVFLYGYTFQCSQSFAVEWGDECVNIYLVRSDVIVSLDSDGNILDIKKVQDTMDNNTYRRYLLYSTRRDIGDAEYVMQNDMGILNLIAPSYSQIIVKDSSGAENIIYDVGKMQFSNMIGTIAIICVVVSVAIVAIVWQFVKLLRKM